MRDVDPTVGEPLRGGVTGRPRRSVRYTSCDVEPGRGRQPAGPGRRQGRCAGRLLRRSTRAATAANVARSAGSANSSSTGTPELVGPVPGPPRPAAGRAAGRAGRRAAPWATSIPPVGCLPRRAATAAPSRRPGRADPVRPSRAAPEPSQRPAVRRPGSSPPGSSPAGTGSSSPGRTRRRASPPRSPRRGPGGRNRSHISPMRQRTLRAEGYPQTFLKIGPHEAGQRSQLPDPGQPSGHTAVICRAAAGSCSTQPASAGNSAEPTSCRVAACATRRSQLASVHVGHDDQRGCPRSCPQSCPRTRRAEPRRAPARVSVKRRRASHHESVTAQAITRETNATASSPEPSTGPFR